MEHVTRFEVIDHRTTNGKCGVDYGRIFSAHNCRIELSVQDDGKTLKVFVDNPPPANNTIQTLLSK